MIEPNREQLYEHMGRYDRFCDELIARSGAGVEERRVMYRRLQALREAVPLVELVYTTKVEKPICIGDN